MILHLGCGRVGRNLRAFDSYEVITLDRDAALKPDIVCNLGVDPIALPDNSIDTAVAIHVLEHIGRQGDTAEWFQFWEELYRVMKPEGRVEFASPLFDSVWAWADPSHTRVLAPESFIFFNQESYRISSSAISPYRIRCDFTALGFSKDDEGTFGGVLQVRKPLKPWWED
jgi:hypothetical protein